MSLLVERLRLRDWRSFDDREIALGEGMTVLLGPNAAGKTNVVEALQLLTAGWSFRRPRPRDLVRSGRAQGSVEARLSGDGRVIDVGCAVREGRRSFMRNNKRVQAADLPGTLMSVLFNPDDLMLVKGPASGRRDELDGFARQANRGYARVLAAYQRAVEQRNRLLRDGAPDLALLDAWDASVATGAAAVLTSRLRLFARLAERVSAAYRSISGGEDAAALTREEVAARMLEALAMARSEDIRRQQTTVGPHRDDVSFVVDGRDARAFASQGQQRSVVLAWKMAELAIAEEVTGERPLLLLDDVMSELDEGRRLAMADFVRRESQVVVTTTNVGYFSDELLRDAEVVRFGD